MVYLSLSVLLLLPLVSNSFQPSGLLRRRWGVAHYHNQKRFPLWLSGSESDVAADQQQASDIASWVIENLEDSNSTITSRSAVLAGENDTLPAEGLLVGEQFRILAADSPHDFVDVARVVPIRLLLGRNGWGTGVHPTTCLCLEWLEKNIQGGETVLDYGCGSGILSIAALRLGASHCIGVDVEAEALVTAERNIHLNELTAFTPLHTRQVLPYELERRADVCVANILVGQLVRPSMVAALVSNLAEDGGILCLSGIRPGDQVESLRQVYGAAGIEWVDYAERTAQETTGSVASYGFDCGAWSLLVGRRRQSGGDSRADEIAAMSEMAVS